MTLTHRLISGPLDPEQEFVRNHISYADLYAMAAHLFHELAGEETVCLYTEDRAVVAAAILSALVGGPRLILPYALNPRVLAEIRQIVPYHTLITSGTTAGDTIPIPGVREFTPQAGKVRWPAAPLPAATCPDIPVLHLFTGGSTGTPAGWPKTAGNLLTETLNIITTYGFCETDRVVATTSPLHIYGLLYSVLAPLGAGAGTIAGAPSFPAEIENTITAQKASILVSVPAHYRAMAHHPCDPFPLRLAFSSAGMLEENDAHAFGAAHHMGINEVYGSTETGGVACRNRFAGETAFTAFSPVAVKLEDDHVHVKSGFLSPTLPLDAEGFYKMGDRAVFTAPNQFILAGRSDSIVKVGGKRVDLSVIRELLRGDPKITEALLLAISVGRARENQIVAVVEGTVNLNDVNQLLAESLEPHARPRQIRVMDKIPVTPAGKYDRKQIESYFTTGHA
ncbi:acyl--CoA ligase [Desulfosarcina sp. OttesenSCG-928-A07]|nr:acyl--CoA ligase [Desulfosarcina sp. OttesenSCG-928-A07]